MLSSLSLSLITAGRSETGWATDKGSESCLSVSNIVHRTKTVQQYEFRCICGNRVVIRPRISAVIVVNALHVHWKLSDQTDFGPKLCLLRAFVTAGCVSVDHTFANLGDNYPSDSQKVRQKNSTNFLEATLSGGSSRAMPLSISSPASSSSMERHPR